MTEAAVQLTGVAKHFGDVIALKTIDLEVADGEFFSLLGPSGCGKTTTLRLIAGFEFPTVGSIRIHGREMALEPPNARPVNTVFQSYALFPHMDVERNVGFGLEMKKVASNEIAERVTRALDMVQLTHRASAKPEQLSGGMRQRVALARALVNEPEVLLLDEPLGALDLKLRQQMQIELKQLQERVGITFIYVTHDQEEALTMSDRIGVMDKGELLQVGAPKDIYESPASRFVADFIGDISLLAVTVTGENEVRILGGETVRVDTRRAAGTDDWLALRPESLHLVPSVGDVPDGMATIAGRVRHRVYYGDSYFYGVETTAGNLDVRQENRPGLPTYDPGRDLHVWWNPSAASLVSQ